ncbi:DUF4395 domain-containing protein [Mucilaginibacter panaciglaebae]|uniref:DUF4395 domain-containing protein n=1 Tax=Mucilaginibacter panaciglaebae TaxID=502331 RepID=A0ABP7WMP1_9SPHI
MANDNLDCPVDFVTVDEHRARLVAFVVLLLAIICFVTLNWGLSLFMLVDFILRALNLNKYSPLSFIAGWLLKASGRKPKPVDRAPKRFAAFVGLVFSLAITIALLTGLFTVARVLLAILMVFAALESLAGFCAGCYVYTYLKTFGLVR